MLSVMRHTDLEWKTWFQFSIVGGKWNWVHYILNVVPRSVLAVFCIVKQSCWANAANKLCKLCPKQTSISKEIPIVSQLVDAHIVPCIVSALHHALWKLLFQLPSPCDTLYLVRLSNTCPFWLPHRTAVRIWFFSTVISFCTEFKLNKKILSSVKWYRNSFLILWWGISKIHEILIGVENKFQCYRYKYLYY